MQRREFITLVGGAAAAWPFSAHAQQPAMPTIGFLNGTSPVTWTPFVVAFRNGLKEAGYIEGQNVAIEYRWAEGHTALLQTLASELVDRQPTVIVVAGGDQVVLAAKNATATIPIVFISGSDPVKLGLVASLNLPGGNLTGITLLTAALEPKRLELLRETVPNASLIALLVNPDYPASRAQVTEVQTAASALGQKILVLNASSEDGLDAAFTRLAQEHAEALLIGSDPFFTTRREKLVALAARYRLPTIYQWREFATIGGLMSYGTDLADSYRLLGGYTGRILKGAKPSDLPVQQSTKVDLVVNLKTAKTLGLAFPLSLLGRADEVIE
jgi:putative tryptophan/tyrosine transport system substrate-binding protein